MSTTLTPEISALLKAPFPNVSWRVQSKKNATAQGKVRVVAYIDARDVMDRLDEVVGPDNWSFDWIPITTANGEVVTAKGMLTVCGVTRSDIGEAGDIEKSKAAVSDALKRAAVHFGCARYLYDLGAQYAALDGNSNILPQEKARLNKMLEDRLSGKVHQHTNQQSTLQGESQAQPKQTQQPRQNDAPAPQSPKSPTKADLEASIKTEREKVGLSEITVERYRQSKNWSPNVEGLGKVLTDLKSPKIVLSLFCKQYSITQESYKKYCLGNETNGDGVYAAIQDDDRRQDIIDTLKSYQPQEASA